MAAWSLERRQLVFPLLARPLSSEKRAAAQGSMHPRRHKNNEVYEWRTNSTKPRQKKVIGEAPFVDPSPPELLETREKQGHLTSTLAA
jgi:hypothetical protein